jgi:hypothetical protein
MSLQALLSSGPFLPAYIIWKCGPVVPNNAFYILTGKLAAVPPHYKAIAYARTYV